MILSLQDQHLCFFFSILLFFITPHSVILSKLLFSAGKDDVEISFYVPFVLLSLPFRSFGNRGFDFSFPAQPTIGQKQLLKNEKER